MALLGTLSQEGVFGHMCFVDSGLNSRQRGLSPFYASYMLLFHPICFFSKEAFLIPLPQGYKMDRLPGYLANTRYDSREFSRFEISSWVHKEDKSGCRTPERQSSQSMAAPGESVKTVESWTLPLRF